MSAFFISRHYTDFAPTDLVAENDYSLSLSKYTFPPRFVPPLWASIDLPRSSSSLGLASPSAGTDTDSHRSPFPSGAHTMSPYMLPRSSSLPALRLRSASDCAPQPPLPPYTAEVYAYGTYTSPGRRGSDDQPNEVLRDESDDGHDGDYAARRFDLKGMLALHPSADASTEDMLSVRGKYRRECSAFDDSCRPFYPTKPGFVFPAARSERVVSSMSKRPQTGTGDMSMVLDTSCITDSTGLPSASSTSSTSSGSDIDLRSPVVSAFYGFARLYEHGDRLSGSMTTATDDVVDIYSALQWNPSGKAPALSIRELSDIGVPQLPPIPKMVDLMDGLFSAYSTPEREEAGKGSAEDEENYNCLLPSYNISTSSPHLAQLASPFLHPRPAPRPPCLSPPSSVARTPIISEVKSVPSCFPSVGSNGLGGLSALGLVLESSDEECTGSGTMGIQHDPFARSFAHVSGIKNTVTPAQLPEYAKQSPFIVRQKSAKSRSRRHSWRPSKASIQHELGPSQYVPYTPPGQVRSVPLRSVAERPSAYSDMSMSRSMPNLHLPLHDASLIELVSEFEHDNEGDASSGNRSPFDRLGRSLTRTRSCLGALLAKGRATPQTPQLEPRDLRPKSPAPVVPVRHIDGADKGKSAGRKFGLGLDTLNRRWIRMGLGRRKSSE